MGARFTPVRRLERQVAHLPGVARLVARTTDRVADRASALARPVSERFDNGLETDVGLDSRGVVGRVNATWWGSLFVEFGTRDQRPHAILRRALDSARRTR